LSHLTSNASSERTHVVVIFDEIDNVGRVISELSDRAALNQLAQFTVNRNLVLRYCKDDGHLGLGNLVCQLAD